MGGSVSNCSRNQDDANSGLLDRLSAGTPLVSGLAGFSGSKSPLETEVKILESPSVLKPTYDFVKKSKTERGERTSWTFLDWRDKNLQIDLVKDTSILNITYRDTDPELVLPVIERISRDYQRYSGSERKRGLDQGVDYLKSRLPS